MPKRILTLDNLYEFFVQQNKNFNFTSNDSNPIVVNVIGNFEAENTEMPGMLKLKLKVCHTLTNRNGSHISEENMTKAMPSLKYRPLLAYIHELEDGTKDFYAHNCEFIENEDGETEVVYTEKQVGCFTADDPWLEYDEDMDKTYVMAYAVVPEEYTDAADIIRRKNGTKVSCELCIDTLEYNAKEKYLNLIDFYFGGCTLLGCDEDGNEIGEGMLGSRADIFDFCHKKPVFNYQDKLVEVLDKLNITLSNLNNVNFTQKGGDAEVDKFNELLEQYGFTEDELDFDYEGMTDEELEAAFEEYACKKKKKCSEEEDGEPEVKEDEACKKKKKCADEEDDNEDDEPVATEDEACKKKKKCAEDDDDDEEDDPEITENEACKKKKKCSLNEEGDMIVSFEISHEDIRYALFNLLSAYEEQDSEYYWISNVYEDYFIYENWSGDKLYKQSYTVDEDNVTFSGDRQEMFKMILTESEKLAVEKMREDYSALETKYNELKEFKEQYDADKIKAEKDVIFESAEYAEIKESEEFKALIADADKYSVDELKVKSDLIFAASMKKKFNFEVENPVNKNNISININEKPDLKKQAYAGLFEE